MLTVDSPLVMISRNEEEMMRQAAMACPSVRAGAIAGGARP
jgi:hypothetical protein